jgi:hypothetical protein
MEVIFLITQLIEKISVTEEGYMIFIDREKTYDKISRNIMWWAFEKK